MSVQMTILGSGTSTGVPLINCPCKVCQSHHPRNQRLRASALVTATGPQGEKKILIDTSPDLRQQALRHQIHHVDAVLYTHSHADHIHGIDELRSYNYVQKQVIPLYGNRETLKDLERKFDYIFDPKPVEGGGIPELSLHPFSTKTKSINILGIKVQVIPLKHGSQDCMGYRFDNVAYVVDCGYISASSLKRLEGLDVLVLDCVRLDPHRTHFNLEQALEVVRQLKPRKTYLSHLGHDFDYGYWSKRLPRGVALAYDGLIIRSKAS